MKYTTKVKVLTPRLMSGEKTGNIKTMHNIEDYPDLFKLSGGVYRKIKTIEVR
jgi:hypothetical protein